MRKPLKIRGREYLTLHFIFKNKNTFHLLEMELITWWFYFHFMHRVKNIYGQQCKPMFANKVKNEIKYFEIVWFCYYKIISIAYSMMLCLFSIFFFFKTINIGKTIYFLGLIHSSCRGFDLIYLVSIHLNFYHILFLLWIRWEIPENKK